MNTNNKPWETDLKEAYALCEAGKYEKALLIVDKVLSFDKNNINARILKSGILIDSWNGDKKSIKNIYEAIDHLKIIIQNVQKNKERYLMNLGNAFSRLAKYDLKAEKKLNQDIIKNLETAKKYYQESLSICESQPDVWINKGNVLDDLGRHFEALYCYDRAILLNSQHYNAWGNRGICCYTLSYLVENKDDKNKLYYDAMIYFAIEFKLYPLVEIDDFYRNLCNNFIQNNKIVVDLNTTLKQQLPKKRAIVEECFNLNSNKDQNFQNFYLNFCELHNLFLNTHFDCQNCGRSSSDVINVSIIGSVNDNIRPYKFFKEWYSLIDDYKTARFYLTLAQYRHPDFLFLDKPRYESDYSLNYYLNVEILKSAFLVAFNIYDKVSYLLNDYEELGIKDENVSFWGGKSIFTIEDKILLKKNDWNKNLIALYSIKKEIEGKEEFTKVKNIRNLITHRYFVLYDIGGIESDNYMNIQEFFKSTLYMLLQLKNILFSLTFFISEKENHKKEIAERNGEIIPKLEWTHECEKNDEITNIAKKTVKKLNKASNKFISSVFETLNDKSNVNEK